MILTALAFACVSKLLQTTANLFGRSALPRYVEDIIRDEFVAERKPTEGSGRPRLYWPVFLESFEPGTEKSSVSLKHNIRMKYNSPSTSAASR